VKYYVLALTIAVAAAQSVTTTYITDLNGRRVEAGTVATKDHERTEITQNLNGRQVPLEQTDERIVRQDGSGKVVEKTIRRYDSQGQLAATERQWIEERSRPNGSTTRITTYRTDVNGRMAESERKSIEMEKQDSVIRTQSVVERPTISGAFQTVEKSSAVTQISASGSQTDETVFQASQNGGFIPSSRLVKETVRNGNKATEKTATYQPFSESGEMRLTEQTVATVTTCPDGSESIEKTLYGSSWNGKVSDRESGPQLREQDFIERTPGPGGSVTESLSVRRPTATDSNRMGPLTKVSETVCTGKCTRDQ